MRLSVPVIALLATLAVPAAAAPSENVVTVRVELSGFDLSSNEGRKAAEARVEAKLREACTIETNSRYGFGRDLIDEKCIADARRDAIAQVERIAADSSRSGRAVAAN